MRTPFEIAQASYEASFTSGPPESPVASYIEELAEKSLSELHDERATLACQEPDDEMPSRLYRTAYANWRSASAALDYEIEEREKAVRTAFSNLPLHQLFTFSTSDPLEQEILDEVKAEYLDEEE